MRKKLRDNPVKVTLYMEERNRLALEKLAKASRESLSQYVENLIESQWESREISIQGRTVTHPPFPSGNAPDGGSGTEK